MTAVIDSIIDAVVGAINSHEWPGVATAEARYQAKTQLADLGSGWHLYVMPASRRTEIATRASDDDYRGVFVAMHHKIEQPESATEDDQRTEMKSLNTFAEEVYEFLRRRDMTVGGNQGTWRTADQPGRIAWATEDRRRARCVGSPTDVAMTAGLARANRKR